MVKAGKVAAAPRKQHYVPQFYLRGFANQNGQLFVVDAKTRKSFMTSPHNIAAERDFNTVDVKGVEPDVLEKAIAEFEGTVAPSLERVRNEAKFKDEADRIAVINLICALGIRNPRKRENIDRVMGEVLQGMAEMTFATKERWEGQVEQMKVEGAWPEGAATDYDDLKKMVKDKEFKFGIAKEFQLGMEIEHFNEILPYFMARRWRIVKARDDAGDFVTTDHPVCLRWSNSENRGQLFAPGYGMADTDILFPLSSRICLIGRFEGNEDTVDADIFCVGSFNSTVMGYAMRQIYAPNDQYYYMRPFPQSFGRGSTLLKDPNLRVRED